MLRASLRGRGRESEGMTGAAAPEFGAGGNPTNSQSTLTEAGSPTAVRTLRRGAPGPGTMTSLEEENEYLEDFFFILVLRWCMLGSTQAGQYHRSTNIACLWQRQLMINTIGNL